MAENGNGPPVKSGEQGESTDHPGTLKISGDSSAPVATMAGPAPTGALQAGQIILDNYEIQRLLAKGGMGEVYLAEHTELGTRHAIKVIKPQLLGDEMIRPLTRREAKVLSQIHSDAVVAYHGFLKDSQGNYYLIMEYVEGPSLKQAIAEKPLSMEDYYILRGRLAQGLMALHQHGVVHRDLAPDNVILPGGDLTQAKLIDLGIAKLIQPDADATIVGDAFAGKLRYASPEQLGMFGNQVGPASDLYSLGLVLAAALRGEALAMGKNPINACALRMEVPDLDTIPKALREQLTALLQPEPGDRPKDLAEFLETWPEPGSEAGRNRRSRQFLTLALVVALLGLGYLFWVSRSSPPPPTALLENFETAVTDGRIMDAASHLATLRDRYPDFPDLPKLQQQLGETIDRAIDDLARDGRAAITAYRLDQAEQTIAQLSRLDENQDHQALRDGLLQRLDQARSVVTQATEVETAIGDGDLQTARRRLERLRAMDKDYPELQTLDRQLDELLASTLATNLADARKAHQQGALEDLRRLRQTLAALFPDHPELTTIDQWIETLEAAAQDARRSQLLATFEQAMDDDDLTRARDLLSQLAGFFADSDPAMLERRQRLDLAIALGDCEAGSQGETPDSRPGLRAQVRCFQDLLRRYPGNPRAREAMAQLADRHADLVREFWAQGERRQAEAILRDLLEFASRYPGLDSLLAALPGIRFSEPLTDGSAGPEMVVIPAGEVLLEVAGEPQRITIPQALAVSRFEVSRALFSHFVDAQDGYRTDAENYAARGYGCFYRDAQGDLITDDTLSNWRNPRFPQQSSHPVVCVTLKDALLFSRWLSTQTNRNYRLPTDAEWEHLARAGDLEPRFWDQIVATDGCSMGNLRQGGEDTRCRDVADSTTATGRFPANAFGVFDLLGNVAEWTCSDAEGDLSALQTCLDSETLQQSLRDNRPAQVWVRGGSWYNSPETLGAGGEHRVPLEIHYPLNQVGFRVVRELALD